MRAELALERDVNQHAGRVVVADVEDRHRLAGAALVDVFGRLIRERDAAESACGIETDGQLLAIVLDDACDGARLYPYLAVVIGARAQVGPIVTSNAPHEVGRARECVHEVPVSRCIRAPAIRETASTTKLGATMLYMPIAAI